LFIFQDNILLATFHVLRQVQPSQNTVGRHLLGEISGSHGNGIAMMTEAASTSETLVNFYQTAQHNSEDSHLHTCRRENLKSHLLQTLCSVMPAD
jgi:hypothetical protein